MNGSSQHRLTTTLLFIIGLALIGASASVAATIAGPAGFGWFGDEPAITGQSLLTDELAVSDELTESLVAAAADARTTGDAVAIEVPVSADFEIDDPSTASRIVWVAAAVVDPVVGVAGLWLLLGIVRSARTGTPFTEANERRLWSLASVVAIGGTVSSMADDFARIFVLERSDLADLFAVEATISFLPIAAGAAIAVLAGIWRLGVTMSDDLAGTI